MNKSHFLSRIIPVLIDSGVSIRIVQKKHLSGKYGGWFGSKPLEYALAINNDSSFGIAVHEYNHFLQWRDDRLFWDKHTDNIDDLFDAVQHDGEVTDQMVEHVVRLEHDCEIRSAEMIADLQLDIDLRHYIMGANAYLFSYHIVQHVGAWTNKSVYNVPQIVNTMPDRLYSADYYLDPSNMPNDFIKHMINLCFK